MTNSPESRVTSQSSSADISTELAARRTGMSFQRTRMSADRTLMSVIRTSLSLIGFGFTIFQVFHKAYQAGMLKSGNAPLNFGIALVVLGIAMLAVGIVYHLKFMIGLRNEREQMKRDGLIHAESVFPVSLTLMVAVLLLVIGMLAILSMVLRHRPIRVSLRLEYDAVLADRVSAPSGIAASPMNSVLLATVIAVTATAAPLPLGGQPLDSPLVVAQAAAPSAHGREQTAPTQSDE